MDLDRLKELNNNYDEYPSDDLLAMILADQETFVRETAPAAAEFDFDALNDLTFFYKFLERDGEGNHTNNDLKAAELLNAREAWTQACYFAVDRARILARDHRADEINEMIEYYSADTTDEDTDAMRYQRTELLALRCAFELAQCRNTSEGKASDAGNRLSHYYSALTSVIRSYTAAPEKYDESLASYIDDLALDLGDDAEVFYTFLCRELLDNFRNNKPFNRTLKKFYLTAAERCYLINIVKYDDTTDHTARCKAMYYLALLLASESRLTDEGEGRTYFTAYNETLVGLIMDFDVYDTLPPRIPSVPPENQNFGRIEECLKLATVVDENAYGGFALLNFHTKHYDTALSSFGKVPAAAGEKYPLLLWCLALCRYKCGKIDYNALVNALNRNLPKLVKEQNEADVLNHYFMACRAEVKGLPQQLIYYLEKECPIHSVLYLAGLTHLNPEQGASDPEAAYRALYASAQAGNVNAEAMLPRFKRNLFGKLTFTQ